MSESEIKTCAIFSYGCKAVNEFKTTAQGERLCKTCSMYLPHALLMGLDKEHVLAAVAVLEAAARQNEYPECCVARKWDNLNAPWMWRLINARWNERAALQEGFPKLPNDDPRLNVCTVNLLPDRLCAMCWQAMEKQDRASLERYFMPDKTIRVLED
ncbi:hypothetical protein BKA66DRAFT_445083 [Pyrenochaeta sp. MPI-SDFR-AT-0127]|nr:hypothetical protein BKA66DRAFT_445083 [Pyrenochaeta sp. MPI-SDFR-AT-0127]